MKKKPSKETPVQKDLRAKKCYNEIQNVLLKHNCTIAPIATQHNNTIELGISINAK